MYLAMRTEGLLMFEWIDMLGLSDLIFQIRYGLEGFVVSTPDWILFSFPDGCWVWSMTAFFTMIWYEETRKIGLAYILTGPVLGIGSELGQFVGLVPGTFDAVDLWCMLFGSLGGYFSTTVWLKKQHTRPSRV